MRRISNRHAMHSLSELNVTPLLDLAFVLLVIFMITTPLMENSTDLSLPRLNSTDANALDPKSVLTVNVTRTGDLRIGQDTLDTDTIRARLAALAAQKKDAALVIRADKNQPVQRVADIMDLAKRAGVQRVGLVTVGDNE
jgi:biopolymer transport protein ExbD